MIILKPELKPFEAGELHVKRDDAITPTRLRMIADDGWTIQDALTVRDGFMLLLTRKVESETPKRIVHQGTSRCPNYCGCVSA